MDFKENVVYFENSDFDEMGRLINPLVKNKPVMILVVSSNCGFCTQIKPEYQKAADILENKVVVGAISMDGNPDPEDESMLKQKLHKIIPGFRGVPVIIFMKKGRLVKEYKNDRTTKTIVEFATDN